MGKTKPAEINEHSTFSLEVGNFWPFIMVIGSFVALYYGITNRLDLMTQKMDFYIEGQKAIAGQQKEQDDRIGRAESDVAVIKTTLGLRSNAQSKSPVATESALVHLPQPTPGQSVVIENRITTTSQSPTPPQPTPAVQPTPTDKPRDPGPSDNLPIPPITIPLIPTLIPLAVSILKR